MRWLSCSRSRKAPATSPASARTWSMCAPGLNRLALGTHARCVSPSYIALASILSMPARELRCMPAELMPRTAWQAHVVCARGSHLLARVVLVLQQLHLAHQHGRLLYHLQHAKALHACRRRMHVAVIAALALNRTRAAAVLAAMRTQVVNRQPAIGQARVPLDAQQRSNRCQATVRVHPALRRALPISAVSKHHWALSRNLPAEARFAHHAELARTAPGLVVLYQPLLQPGVAKSQMSSATKGAKRRPAVSAPFSAGQQRVE